MVINHFGAVAYALVGGAALRDEAMVYELAIVPGWSEAERQRSLAALKLAREQAGWRFLLFTEQGMASPAAFCIEKGRYGPIREAAQRRQRMVLLLGVPVLVGLLIFAVSQSPDSTARAPSVASKQGGDVGTVQQTISSSYSHKTAGFVIGSEVYRVATKNPGLTRVVVNCELSVAGGLQDKYGNPVKGPYTMGSIGINNLEEVRRYTDADTYAVGNQEWYASQIRGLNYAEFLEK